MTLAEIKEAVNSGKTVYQHSNIYQVKKSLFKDGEENWLIVCTANNHAIGLTWLDGTTMNGKEEDFYTLD